MGRFNGENITGKVLAGLLAIILWVYVMNEQNPPVEQTVTVKLEVRAVPEGLVVTANPDGIKIRFQGPRSIIAGLRAQDLGAYVDVRNLGEGEHSVSVKTVTPVPLDILDVSPKVVAVHLEGQTSRQLPIVPRFTGTPVSGAAVSKAAIKPNTITVNGPRSKIDLIDSVIAFVNVDGLERDITLEGTPRAYMKNGVVVEQVTFVPDKIQLDISVQSSITKRVDVKPVVAGQPAAGRVITRVTAEPESVEIRGQADALKVTDWLNTVPIDVSGQSIDIVREVKLQSREGIVANDTVKVTISIAAAS